MRKSIYYLTLIDGKTIIETSRPKLSDRLHRYILEIGKEKEWFVINVNQLDCMIYDRVQKNRHEYIKDCGKCFVDEIINTDDIKLTRSNGEPYKKQTIRSKYNKRYNSEIEKWIDDPTKCNIENFKRLSVFSS